MKFILPLIALFCLSGCQPTGGASSTTQPAIPNASSAQILAGFETANAIAWPIVVAVICRRLAESPLFAIENPIKFSGAKIGAEAGINPVFGVKSRAEFHHDMTANFNQIPSIRPIDPEISW